MVKKAFDGRHERYLRKIEEIMHVQNSKYDNPSHTKLESENIQIDVPVWNKKPEDPHKKVEDEIRAELQAKFDEFFGYLDEEEDDIEVGNPCLPGDIDSDCYDEDGNIVIPN